jgi:imidazolonepropionase-like amidohydrolase
VTIDPLQRTLFKEVNVIDVEVGRIVPERDVLVECDRIAVVATSIPESSAASVIDGRNRYLIPGLFDCHVHLAFNGYLSTPSDYRKNLKQFLFHGITQVVDFFTVGGTFPGSSPETIRDDINSGRVLGPWFLTSYGCLNAPGGFCSCSVGAAASEVVTLDDVRRELDRIDHVKPDFVKIVYDDVFGTLPNLTPELLGDLIDETHHRGYRAAVHIASLADAREAVRRGADILGHGIIEPIPDDFLREMASRGVIMIPTLSSYEARSLPRWRISLPSHPPAETLYAYSKEEQSIYERKGQISLYRDAYFHAARNIVPMLEAGIHLAAGSDSGTWYTFPGEALHRELAIYCEHGVSPAVALRMATIDAARAFQLDGRFGTIGAEKTANLVLLSANPLMNIGLTRNIDAVMLNGILLDLDQLKADVSAPLAHAPTDSNEEVCSPHHFRPDRLTRSDAGIEA